MSYFVLGPDGAKYGPADVATLQQWITENRLQPESELENGATGEKVVAQNLAGLRFATAASEGPPPGTGFSPSGSPSSQPGPINNPYSQAPGQAPYVQYPRYAAGPYDAGAGDVKTAWILAAISLLCCGIILGPVAIYFASRAKQKGSPNTTGPMVLGIISTVLAVVWIVVAVIVRY